MKLSRDSLGQPVEYLHLQMKLEGIGLDAQNLLVQVDPSGDNLPLAIFASLSTGEQVASFSADLQPGLRQELVQAAAAAIFPDVTGLLQLLEEPGISSKSEHYKTCVFPPEYALASTAGTTVLHQQTPEVSAFGFGGPGEEIFAVERDGVILSACVSSRQNEQCAESWVFTIPEERNKGLARRVVTAWARYMLLARLVPFYSHKIENYPSSRLASSLGLTPVFEEVVIERTKAVT